MSSVEHRTSQCPELFAEEDDDSFLQVEPSVEDLLGRESKNKKKPI